MPVILDWRAAAPDELARQAAQSIASGALIVVPSEVGYVLVADPANLSTPNRPSGLPDSLQTTRLEGFFDPREFFVRTLTTPAERALASRLWPGPIGWVDDDLPFPVWIPAHTALASVLAFYRSPLALFELSTTSPVDLPDLGERIDLAITDGPPRPGRLTIIRPNDAGWAIVRAGSMDQIDIQGRLARKIVFVCTGNTCRSPMAEGLFKQKLAERLRCKINELPERGYAITSAGLSASSDDPAALDSIAVLGEFGLDLTSHRSQPTSYNLVATADDLIVMTRSHLQLLMSRYPTFNGAIRLLCGMDGDLDDPIGRGPEVYRACASVVQYHVERLIWEMGLS